MVVDDEIEHLEAIAAVLAEDGHDVTTFLDAGQALEHMAQREPDLIISDVVMPGMTGLQLREEHAQRFPERTTPFIFLSSLGEPDDMVTGLEMGADDYLVKPVHADVIRAKVRALLRRRARRPAAAFTGRIEHFPFARILQFCEIKALTGDVLFEADDFSTAVTIRGGAMILGGTMNYDMLDRLAALKNGTFTIRVARVDFDEIAFAEEGVPGKLSIVRLNEREVQLQTELVDGAGAGRRVVTLISLGGKPVVKRASAPVGGLERAAIAKLVDEQHAALEAQVDRLVRTAAAAPLEPVLDSPSAQQRVGELYDAGFDAYLRQDYPAAIRAWEQARAIDPDNKAILVNLEVVRKKMQGEPG